MKKYIIKLDEEELFIILNSLYSRRALNESKKIDKKITEIINKFDEIYFNEK